MSVATGYDEMNQFINYDGSKGPFRGKVAHQEGTRPMVVLVIRTIVAGIWVAFFQECVVDRTRIVRRSATPSSMISRATSDPCR